MSTAVLCSRWSVVLRHSPDSRILPAARDGGSHFVRVQKGSERPIPLCGTVHPPVRHHHLCDLPDVLLLVDVLGQQEEQSHFAVIERLVLAAARHPPESACDILQLVQDNEFLRGIDHLLYRSLIGHRHHRGLRRVPLRHLGHERVAARQSQGRNHQRTGRGCTAGTCGHRYRSSCSVTFTLAAPRWSSMLRHSPKTCT